MPVSFSELKPSKFNQYGPRIRFEWGYSAAMLDNAKRQIRKLEETPSRGSAREVVKSKDPYFFAGYAEAISNLYACRASIRIVDAWREYYEGLTPTDKVVIVELEAMADLAGIEKAKFTLEAWRNALANANNLIIWR